MTDLPVLRLLERLERLIDDTLGLRRLNTTDALGIVESLSAAYEARSARAGDDEIERLLARMRTSALAAESGSEAALESFVKDGWSLVVEVQRLSEADTQRARCFPGLHRSGCGATREARVGS